MSESSSSSGIGFFGLLTLIFVVLKLTHIIDWSWWFVLLPMYGGFVLGVIALIIFLLWLKSR